MSSELTREPLPLPPTEPLPIPSSFAQAASALGYAGTAEQTQTLAQYLAALLAMNEQMNLTAITSQDAKNASSITDTATVADQTQAVASTVSRMPLLISKKSPSLLARICSILYRW